MHPLVSPIDCLVIADFWKIVNRSLVVSYIVMTQHDTWHTSISNNFCLVLDDHKYTHLGSLQFYLTLPKMSTDHRLPNSFFPPVSQPSQYRPLQRRDPPAQIPRIPDNDDPSTEWLPIYNKRTPYVEAEIVHLIHEIIRNFVRLSPVSEAEVTWPPEGGHHLDEALCNELNISDAAKSLIGLLPCPRNCILPIFLYQSSQLFDILDNGFSLRYSRESPSFEEGKTPASECYILPHDVMLSSGDPETPILILDTIES